MAIRDLYVFDLDGTLADTAELTNGRRSPANLLVRDPLDYELDASPTGWAKFNALGIDMSSVPGLASARGHQTAVITRAPQAYASTLVGLLGLERHLLWPSSHSADRSTKLQRLAQFYKLPIDRVIYVGDTDEDRAAAHRAGCRFIDVDWFAGPAEVINLPELQVDEDSVSEIVSSLLRNPVHRRLELQTRLARLVQPEHRYCLIRPREVLAQPLGAFLEASVHPRLFTKNERGEPYLLFLRNLFPTHRTTPVRASAGDSHYICGYVKLGQEGSPDADPLGNLFRIIKQYQKTSGPEVEFGSLPLVAHVLAAHIASWFREVDGFVDHVAPNNFHADSPGRTSSWLARMVADTISATLDTNWAAMATVLRSERQRYPNPTFDATPRWSVLIDDQRTTGKSLGRHIDCSPMTKWEATLTWSHSNPPTPTRPDSQFRRTKQDCFWPDDDPCPIHDLRSFMIDDIPQVPPPETAPRAFPSQEPSSGVARMLATKKTHPLAWARWEPVDDAMLRQLFDEGMPSEEISRIMQRTPKAIESRLQRLFDSRKDV